MKISKYVSRRDFIRKAALTTSLAAFSKPVLFSKSTAKFNQTQKRLPREVWIATVSQAGLTADTPEKKVQTILEIIEKSLVYRPDVICLPEVFMSSGVKRGMTLTEQVNISGELLKEFMFFAQKNYCYMICPVMTRENDRIYNSAVVIDRQGNYIGEYRKIHLPDDELKAGITPGPLQPPVFMTDFGMMGIQICFDCCWDDGWKALRQQGAEIVFWPSAYSGGQVINAKAWQNKYPVISSTNEISKICDISGEIVAQTGIWDKNIICAPVNLEKVFLHTWPSIRLFDQIRTKYGRKIKITNYHEEQWSIIESLSPDVRVNDILKEFNIPSFEQLTSQAEMEANKLRI